MWADRRSAPVRKPGMVAGPPAGGTGAAHQGLIYRGERELLGTVVPFLREGITAGEPVLVVLDDHKQGLLRDVLGPDAAAVEWADPGGWYTFAPHTLRRAHQFAGRHPGCRARLLGEVVWAGRSAAEVAQWARYEALLTVALPGTPILCAYDASTLDEAIVATAGHTHPVLHDPAGLHDAAGLHSAAGLHDAAGNGGRGLRSGDLARPSVTFVDLPEFFAAGDAVALPARPTTARAFGFGPGDLRAVRGFVAAHAEDAGLGGDRSEDLVTAVSEATSNAIEHGDGHGMLWIWTDTTRLVCEVGNPAGPIGDPLAGQLPPDPHSPRGRGLWFMRQLADLVELRSSTGATTVRLHMWR